MNFQKNSFSPTATRDRSDFEIIPCKGKIVKIFPEKSNIMESIKFWAKILKNFSLNCYIMEGIKYTDFRKKIVKKFRLNCYIMRGIKITSKNAKKIPEKTYIMDTIKFHVGKMVHLLKNVLISE